MSKENRIINKGKNVFLCKSIYLQNIDFLLFSSVKAWNRNPELYYIVQVQVNSVKGTPLEKFWLDSNIIKTMSPRLLMKSE